MINKILKGKCQFSAFAQLSEHISKRDLLDKDQYFTFQRRMLRLKEQARREPPSVWNDKLNPTQAEKIALLVQSTAELGLVETRYFEALLEASRTKILKLDPISRALSQDEFNGQCRELILIQVDNVFPGANPKWIEQQQAIASLWPLGEEGISKAFSMVSGGSSGQTGSQKPASQAQEEVPEVKVKAAEAEKSSYDIQLVAFDAAQKLKLIKEVREITKLGLKEAKDLVESAPCTLMKAVKKSDADALKIKLEEMKCTINLL